MPLDTDYLLSAAAVRERCALVLAAAEHGATPHFRLANERLPAVAQLVAEVTRRRYPDLGVPLHSRWRHFAAGGLERAGLVAPGTDPAETARARIDLTIVSVLLDAGAGPDWRFREEETGQVLARSEGLAVASLRAMQNGLFSADPAQPWRADAAALASLTPQRLGAAFQHGPANEFAGLEGRAALLRTLGAVTASAPALFGREGGSAGSTIIGCRGAMICRHRRSFATCCGRSARSGRDGSNWPACRSAIAGGTARWPATDWCRCTSSASGSPIR